MPLERADDRVDPVARIAVDSFDAVLGQALQDEVGRQLAHSDWVADLRSTETRALVKARLSAQNSPARAGEEPDLEQQRHDLRLADRLPVEALDGETLLPATLLHLLDERDERSAEPAFLGITERHERAAAALDEERRLASEKDDLGPCNPRGARTRALGPRQSRAVGLRGVSG